jgi:WD40 repeat protein
MQLQLKGNFFEISADCKTYLGERGLYNLENGSLITTKIDWSPLNSANRVAISNDGKFVAISNFEGQIVLNDVVAGKAVPLLGHRRRIFSMQFNADSSELIVASYDETVRIFDIKHGLIKARKVPSHAKSVYAGQAGPLLSPDEYPQLGFSDDDADKPQTVQVFNSPDSAATTQVAIPSDWKVGSLHLLLDTESRNVMLCKRFRCPDEPIREIQAETSTSGSGARARSSPNSRFVVAVEEKEVVKVFDLNRQDNEPVFTYRSDKLLDASFDAKGDWLYILDGQNLLEVPVGLSQLADMVDTRLKYCLTATERETSLIEWAWLAKRRAAACPFQ